jgi:arylsulfatase A-like enzyme
VRPRTPLARRPTVLLAGAVLVVGAVVALHRWPAATAGAGAARYNVVIVLIDTLRADRLGCYGHRRASSPRIDALARDATVFEHANAPAPWTLPSIPSLLTGVLPCEHRVLRDGDRLPDGIETLAERLKRLRYATYSLFHNPYAGPLTGLQRGFDVSRMTENSDGTAVDEFLGDGAPRPIFLYVHNTEPHNPYDARDEYIRPFGDVPPAVREELGRHSTAYRRLTRVDADADRPLGTTDNSALQIQALRDIDALGGAADVLYDAAVLEADGRVGSIIDRLVARGLWDDTLFILTADHGEEMGEHGGWQHDQSLYEELVHVPLIIHFPRGAHAGRRVGDVVGLIDVVPTVMDVLQRPDLTGAARGRSLLPLVRDAARASTDEPVIDAVRINRKKYFRPWKEQRGDVNVAVRQAQWKAIWNAEPRTLELYDLSRDPGEHADVSGGYPQRAAIYRELAERFLTDCGPGGVAAGPAPAPLDEATRQRLSVLGYAVDADGAAAPRSSGGGTTSPAGSRAAP